MNSISNLTKEAIELLQSLIQTPSLSRQEDETATILKIYLDKYCTNVHRLKNNIWVKNLHFDDTKPTIL